MVVFIILLLIAILIPILLFTNNPIIKKLHGGPFPFNRKKVKKFLLGNNMTDGFLYHFALYIMLVIISFIFIYPIIFMVLTSIKSVADLADSSMGWIPSGFEFANYKEAIVKLDYFKSLYKTMLVALIPSLLNVVVGCLTAYGFAKFNFPFKKVLFGLMLATFIVPKALISIPQYAWYAKLKMLGSIWTYVLPASLGQGLYFALYFLILFSTFKQIPKQLEESAKIDGANNITIFFKIMLPLVIPSMITVFLFSFVWYWNDSDMASMYLNVAKAGQPAFWVTLPVALQNYQNEIFAITQGGQLTVLYQGIKMAGTLLSILPLLFIYFALQRYFVEGIEKSGITGE